MPARTAGSDRRVPRGFARLRSLPEGEVAGTVLFVFVDVDARAVGHAGKIFFRKLAVAGKFRDAEIVRTVVGAIRKALLHERGDKVGHLIDVFGGEHQNRPLNVQRSRIFQEGLGKLRGVLLHSHAIARGIANDFVVHVGDVHDVADFVSALAEKAIEKINRDECAEITDVAIVIDGWSTGVHANAVAVQRMKVFDLSGKSVIEAECHR